VWSVCLRVCLFACLSVCLHVCLCGLCVLCCSCDITSSSGVKNCPGKTVLLTDVYVRMFGLLTRGESNLTKGPHRRSHKSCHIYSTDASGSVTSSLFVYMRRVVHSSFQTAFFCVNANVNKVYMYMSQAKCCL